MTAIGLNESQGRAVASSLQCSSWPLEDCRREDTSKPRASIYNKGHETVGLELRSFAPRTLKPSKRTVTRTPTAPTLILRLSSPTDSALDQVNEHLGHLSNLQDKRMNPPPPHSTRLVILLPFGLPSSLSVGSALCLVVVGAQARGYDVPNPGLAASSLTIAVFQKLLNSVPFYSC